MSSAWTEVSNVRERLEVHRHLFAVRPRPDHPDLESVRSTSMTATETSNSDLVTARVDALLAEHDPKSMTAADMLGAQYDAGPGVGPLPRGLRRPRVRPAAARTSTRGCAKPARPRRTIASRSWPACRAPTIVTHGSDDAKQRFLRPMFTGEESWCQLFSEPGAGLRPRRSARTRAVRDGDEWVVNGQKVWNTLAHIADFGMLVARTDPERRSTRVSRYFVVDMHAPGVEVRPLRQITGEAEFNEVYLTDVRVPDSDRIGDVGEGWGVSLTTLMNERVTIGGGGCTGGPKRGGSDRRGDAHRGRTRPIDRTPERRDRADEAVVRRRGASTHQPARLGRGASGQSRS